MSERTYFRESNVAISHRTRWCLTRIAKAQAKLEEVQDVLHVPSTVDALAELLLTKWLEEHHPELIELYKQREQLDTQAEARVNERKM